MAEAYPEKVAYSVLDQGVLTFGEWDRMANRIGRGLARRGLRTGERVGLHTPHEDAVPWLIAYAAVHRAGGVVVPMNPRLSVPEVTRMMSHSGARMVLAGKPQLSIYEELPEVFEGVELALEFVIDLEPHERDQLIGRRQRVRWDDLLDEDEDDFQVSLTDDDLADILYTSGTTGKPKGVAVRHGNASLVPGGVPKWSGNRWLHASPYYTFAGSSFIYNPMKLGMEGVYMPRFDAARWFDAVEEIRPLAVFLVPAMAHLLMAHERFSVADLGSIYMCSVGSAPLAPHALEALQERMPDASVSNNYGMTEAGSAYCVMPKGEAVRRPGSVGQPAPPAKVRIVDSQDGEVTAGEIGEVHLQMPGRQREYFNDPEASAALWGSDGWIRTGDVGKIDSDGYLYIIGRQKDVIIRGGNNVHASDVEHVISSHPDVLEVGVVGIEHEVLGEDVVAAVVLKSGATPNPDELRAFTLQQLTSYKVPRRWYVVDSLPRNPTGKVIKPELKSMLALLEPYVASP